MRRCKKWISRGYAWAWLRGHAKSSAPNQTSTPIGWACQLLAQLVWVSNQTCPCLKLSIVEALLGTILSCLLKITILVFVERTRQVANWSMGYIYLQIFHSYHSNQARVASNSLKYTENYLMFASEFLQLRPECCQLLLHDIRPDLGHILPNQPELVLKVSRNTFVSNCKLGPKSLS
jgi:hypothetical protein